MKDGREIVSLPLSLLYFYLLPLLTLIVFPSILFVRPSVNLLRFLLPYLFFILKHLLHSYSSDLKSFSYLYLLGAGIA
jgi:uncharacterized membrane protein